MLLLSKLLVDRGFLHAFPTRESEDVELLSHLGIEAVVQVKQVHGALAVEAGAAAGAEADAIVARASASAVAVGVRVADCVPLLLADARSGDVVAVHAGWRGVVAGVVPAAARALTSPAARATPAATVGAAPGAVAVAAGGSLYAAIGPCIGPCCFEVGREVSEAIARACEGGSAVARQGTPAAGIVVWEARSKAYVNLRAAVRAQLRTFGVADSSIDDVPGCTKHEAERFHSYRRDGPSSGRMLAAIAARR
jgi:polyphenol oxidase